MAEEGDLVAEGAEGAEDSSNIRSGVAATAAILPRMTWLIGIDEAGYGPNLGPLVVAATAWRVNDEPTALAPSARTNAPLIDLYAQLANCVATKPTPDHLAIADSKLLYKPRGGLQWLEQAVLIGLATVNTPPTARWQQIWEATLADPAGHRHDLPWYANYDCPLPIDAIAAELDDIQNKFQSACCAANVQLVDLRARAVFPGEFNDLTEHRGTKGAALSHISIALLKEVINTLAPSPHPLAPLLITCDKHGGRNRYAEILQEHFPEDPIETLLESRPASRYRWGPPERRIEICFRTKGEAELPTALASMTAKYHRELAMQAFNAYWTEKIPGLRPTAGYPVDAKRFKAEIADMQKKLAIDDHDLWRNR